MYVTTFPCHLCAKHVVASGIKRLVYLEPYPKSYATELHVDSIELEGDGKVDKVSFEPFKGVSPQRYRDLFEKGKRKLTGGAALPWHEGLRHPMIEVYYPSYFQAEIYVVAKLEEGLEKLIKVVPTL
jgi:cytidine deaminase